MSASLDKEVNVFKDRGYLLIYDVPKGTNAYMSANLMESEAVFARNIPAKIVDAYYDRDLDKVVIRMSFTQK